MPHLTLKHTAVDDADGLRTLLSFKQVQPGATVPADTADETTLILSRAQKKSLRPGVRIRRPDTATGVELAIVQPVETSLKVARTAFFNSIMGWRREVENFRGVWPTDDLNEAEEHLRWGGDGGVIISHDTTIAKANRIAFLYLMGRGAKDITSVVGYLKASLTPAPPTGPSVWVDPTTLFPVTLANSVAVAGSLPAGAVFIDLASWVEGED